MNLPTASFVGSHLRDFVGLRTPEGYLDLFAITDAGIFEVAHDGLKPSERVPSACQSLLPGAFAGSVVEDVRTDGESLFVMITGNRSIVYEFVLGDGSGPTESVRFVVDSGEIDHIRNYFKDPDVRALSV